MRRGVRGGVHALNCFNAYNARITFSRGARYYFIITGSERAARLCCFADYKGGADGRRKSVGVNSIRARRVAGYIVIHVVLLIVSLFAPAELLLIPTEYLGEAD